jgi:hypothetical protein
MFRPDCADHHVALLQSIFSAEQNVLGFPNRPRFNKIDSVLCLVALAFVRIELEVHDVDLTKTPASPASRAAPMRDHALRPKTPRSLVNYRKRLSFREAPKPAREGRLAITRKPASTPPATAAYSLHIRVRAFAAFGDEAVDPRGDNGQRYRAELEHGLTPRDPLKR